MKACWFHIKNVAAWDRDDRLGLLTDCVWQAEGMAVLGTLGPRLFIGT